MVDGFVGCEDGDADHGVDADECDRDGDGWGYYSHAGYGTVVGDDGDGELYGDGCDCGVVCDVGGYGDDDGDGGDIGINVVGDGGVYVDIDRTGSAGVLCVLSEGSVIDRDPAIVRTPGRCVLC